MRHLRSKYGKNNLRTASHRAFIPQRIAPYGNLEPKSNRLTLCCSHIIGIPHNIAPNNPGTTTRCRFTTSACNSWNSSTTEKLRFVREDQRYGGWTALTKIDTPILNASNIYVVTKPPPQGSEQKQLKISIRAKTWICWNWSNLPNDLKNRPPDIQATGERNIYPFTVYDGNYFSIERNEFFYGVPAPGFWRYWYFRQFM